jgi:hypothetical protein
MVLCSLQTGRLMTCRKEGAFYPADCVCVCVCDRERERENVSARPCLPDFIASNARRHISSIYTVAEYLKSHIQRTSHI